MCRPLKILLLLFGFPLFTFAQQRGKGDNTSAGDINSMAQAPDLQTRDILNLPLAYSLKIYCPPVGNQGKYATCVAWSSTYAARSILYAIKKRVIKQDSNMRYTFSPELTYDGIKQLHDSSCERGASIEKALAFLKFKGAVFRKFYPVDCGAIIHDSVLKQASSWRIKSYQALCPYGKVDKDVVLKIKRSISSQRPVVTSLAYFKSLLSIDSLGGTWVNDSNDIRGRETERHSMCIVGFDDTVNGGSFEIMNSWGTVWAQRGFFWLSYKQFLNYGLYAVEVID